MKTYFKTQVFPTQYETAERLAMDFIRFAENMLLFREYLYIGLSGGKTYMLMYEIIAREFYKSVQWEKIHFFWVDERCVPYTSSESNYGNAFRTLFSKTDIPVDNLHYIHGNEDPVKEVIRYTGEILANVPYNNYYPSFDLILLGMGDDGHTASIFPGQPNFFDTTSICAVNEHPHTNQKRITLTGKSINNSTLIVFLVLGIDKAEMIRIVFSNEPESYSLPVKRISQKSGQLAWYLDNESSMYVNLKE